MVPTNDISGVVYKNTPTKRNNKTVLKKYCQNYRKENNDSIPTINSKIHPYIIFITTLQIETTQEVGCKNPELDDDKEYHLPRTGNGGCKTLWRRYIFDPVVPLQLSDDFDKHSKEKKAKAKEACLLHLGRALKFPIWTEDKIPRPGNRYDMKRPLVSKPLIVCL